MSTHEDYEETTPEYPGPGTFGPHAETVYQAVSSKLDEFYSSNRYDQLASFGVVRSEPQFMEYIGEHKAYRVDQTLHVHAHSYKVHGATNAAIVAREQAELQSAHLMELNVASAGNHGEACASIGMMMGLHVTIETDHRASQAKVDAMKNRGATVHDIHASLPDALSVASSKGRQSGHVFIPPYNHLDVITGQAVLGVQLHEDLVKHGTQGTVVVPAAVGGGGHLSGLVCGYRYAAEKAAASGFSQPFEVEFVGVQMENADPARRAIANKHNNQPYERMTDLFKDVEPDTTNDGTFAIPGELTMSVISDERAVKRFVVVSKGAVGASMYRQSRQTGHDVEPAGALSGAGAKKLAKDYDTPVTFVAYLTGSNVTEHIKQQYLKAYLDDVRSEEKARAETILRERAQYSNLVRSVGSSALEASSPASHASTIAHSPTGAFRRAPV